MVRRILTGLAALFALALAGLWILGRGGAVSRPRCRPGYRSLPSITTLYRAESYWMLVTAY